MAVSHLASSESHGGTTGSTTAVPFNWLHTPGANPRGVTVFVRTAANAGVTLATGVTYAGVTVPAVTGGEALRTTGSLVGNVKMFHLGINVPTASPATVEVSRTGTASMYAVCITTAANGDTEIYEAGIEKDQGNSAITERAIDDGDARSDCVRYACGMVEYATPPPVGTNTTSLQTIDFGSQCGVAAMETTPGQGDRMLGWENVTTAEKILLYVTVREKPGILHLAASQSHSNNIGSVSQSSFTWNHTPGVNPRGVLVFVWTAQESSITESVTYGGMAVSAVVGGEAHRSGGEEGSIETFFLGANIPASDPASVVVTRANTADRMWAVCITVGAGYNLEVYTPGIVALTPTGALTEVSVDDGSPGTPSQRYAGGHFAYDSPPAVGIGANSTLLFSFDPGTRSGSVVRETVPGQGARPVGWDEPLAEEKAVVYLALREILPAAPVGTLNVVVYGYAWPISPIEPGVASLTQMLADVLHIADSTPVVLNPAQVTFTASPDHATVTNYTAQLWTYPTHGASPVNTLSLGVPTPNASNTITADLSALYAGQPAGDYTVVIVTTTAAGGSTPSEDSNAFTLPLV